MELIYCILLNLQLINVMPKKWKFRLEDAWDFKNYVYGESYNNQDYLISITDEFLEIFESESLYYFFNNLMNSAIILENSKDYCFSTLTTLVKDKISDLKNKPEPIDKKWECVIQ